MEWLIRKVLNKVADRFLVLMTARVNQAKADNDTVAEYYWLNQIADLKRASTAFNSK